VEISKSIKGLENQKKNPFPSISPDTFFFSFLEPDKKKRKRKEKKKKKRSRPKKTDPNNRPNPTQPKHAPPFSVGNKMRNLRKHPSITKQPYIPEKDDRNKRKWRKSEIGRQKAESKDGR